MVGLIDRSVSAPVGGRHAQLVCRFRTQKAISLFFSKVPKGFIGTLSKMPALGDLYIW